MAGWFEQNSPTQPMRTFYGAGQQSGPMAQTSGTPDHGRYPWVPWSPEPPAQTPPASGGTPPANTPPATPPNGALPPWQAPVIAKTPPGGDVKNKQWVTQQILWVANQLKAQGKYVNPSVFNDPGYWADRIIEKGGWIDGGPDLNNIKYFTERFQMREGEYQDGGGGNPYDAPLLKGYGKEFVEPTFDEIMNSPVVKARLALGMRALENSAAAKGTVLSGGIIRDIDAFGQEVASDEYAKEVDRRLGISGFNRDTVWGDDDRRFSRLADFTRLGQAGAAGAADAGSGYGSAPGDASGGTPAPTTPGTTEPATPPGRVARPRSVNLYDTTGVTNWGQLLRRTA